MSVIAIIALAFALLVAVFAVQNSTPVSVSFFNWHIGNVSLALVILGSAAAGAAASGLISLVREIGFRLALRSYRGKAEKCAQELDAAKEEASESEKRAARLMQEIQAKDLELDEKARQIEALEVELEATRSMEVLPRPAGDDERSEAGP